jgi:hypothetical protein
MAGLMAVLAIGGTDPRSCVLAADASPAPSLTSEPPPLFSLEDGLASNSPWVKPGKVDFLYRGTEHGNEYNAFLWTPSFKGGGGFLNPRHQDSTTYLGGFARPLAVWPERGDLILGVNAVEDARRRDTDVQGEYRFPFGLGFGGGHVEASRAGNDITFGKTTWRSKVAQWNFILEMQGQDVGGSASPGGYAAVYNPQVMGVFGHDGEQWRATLGWVTPTNHTMFRPVMEVLYVDNSIGHFDGPRVIFANASLNYRGGFLSHPARLGRAMGPQGLEFGNPLGFLTPTWNRRLDTWELGGLMNLRFEHIWRPDRTITERYEGLVFPFQFFDGGDILNPLFAGGAYSSSAAQNSPSVLGGWSGKLAFVNFSVGVEYLFRPSETSVVVGVVDWF